MRKVTKSAIIWLSTGILVIWICRTLILSEKRPGTSAQNLAHDLFFSFNRALLHPNTTEIAERRKTTKAVVIPKKTEGYNLAKRLRDKCGTKKYNLQEKVFGSYFATSTHTCIIWKIGTTYLKRLYMIKRVPEFRDIINPYEIRFDKRYLPGPKISNGPNDTRFIFVRDPYNRLISGYVDKLLAPNPVFWKVIGVPAIRLSRKLNTTQNRKSFQCGHDLTFKEYVSYVISTLAPKRGTKPHSPDGHFNRMTSLCKPCAVKYDFVGKMESFSVDVLELAHRLKISNQTIRFLESSEGGKYAWLDAVKDSAHQPFDKNFAREYKSCITFYEALQRSWKKMQTRGLIGKEAFPLSNDKVSNLTEEEFVQIAVRSREKSSSKERNDLKNKYFAEMFATISIADLEMLRKIYADDFRLFEYDDRPTVIFSRNKTK